VKQKRVLYSNIPPERNTNRMQTAWRRWTDRYKNDFTAATSIHTSSTQLVQLYV